MRPWTPIQRNLERKAGRRTLWLAAAAGALVKAIVVLAGFGDDPPIYPRWGF